MSTAYRVNRNTSPASNRQIQDDIDDRVGWYATHRKQIGTRLKELDAEWDIERMLEVNASAVAFAGVVLGATLDRRFYALPAVVTAFLFQHAVQGWCPPLPVLRKMGFRTAREIDVERNALKALRGDFRGSRRANGSAQHALDAARA
jgi:hypothetical protein